MAETLTQYPEDFLRCVDFHGHVCPGLAIGYAAAKTARRILGDQRARDEEIVAIVENDSCSVDAIQVLMGCTFGKGNLIFRDWGKQVFTFLDRGSGKGLRVCFEGPIPGLKERQALRAKIEAGTATEEEKKEFQVLREKAVLDLVQSDPERFFQIREVRIPFPPFARIVDTVRCAVCGEYTMTTRLASTHRGDVCQECAAEDNT